MNDEVGPSLCTLYLFTIIWAMQATAGDNEVKLMMKLATEWVRTTGLVIRSQARYFWITAPVF